MTSNEILIEFTNASPAESGQLAPELISDLTTKFPELQVELKKQSATSQDFGTVIGVILGANATLMIAKGIAAYLRRNSGVKISVKTANGHVVASNLDSSDAAKIAEALAKADVQ